MNAVAMTRHSQYHQRELSRNPLCPVCKAEVEYGEWGVWVCPTHGSTTAPRWESGDAPCPFPHLHEAPG